MSAETLFGRIAHVDAKQAEHQGDKANADDAAKCDRKGDEYNRHGEAPIFEAAHIANVKADFNG